MQGIENKQKNINWQIGSNLQLGSRISILEPSCDLRASLQIMGGDTSPIQKETLSRSRGRESGLSQNLAWHCSWPYR